MSLQLELPELNPSQPLIVSTPLYHKSTGFKQTIAKNLQFFSFKMRLRKIYNAIEFERSRQESNTFSTDLESLEIFEIFSTGLMKNRSLQILNLSSTNLPDLNMIRLSQSLAKNKTLTHFDLSNNNLSSLALKYLFRMLKENNHLQNLNLFNNEIQKESIQDISSMIISNKSLVDLNLNFCGMDSLSCRGLLEALTSNSHFKQVHLSKNFFDDKSFQAFSYFLSKSFMKLEKLEFAFNMLDEKSLKIIKRRMMRLPIEKLMPTIHEISLMGNKFNNPEAIKCLKYILERINGIQTLNLSKTFLSYKNIADLMNSFKRVHQTLVLSNNIFKDQFPENLSCLIHLKHLNLSMTKLTGGSIINIAKTIKNEKKLQWISLDLSRNQIDDCRILLDSLRTNKTLLILNLSDNLIDEGSFDDFTTYCGELSLKELNLSENPFNASDFIGKLFVQHENFPLRTVFLENIILKNKNFLIGDSGIKNAFLNSSLSINKLEKLSVKNSLPIGPLIIHALNNFSNLMELNLENSCILNKDLIEDLGLYLGLTDKLTILSLKNLYLGRLFPKETEVLCNALTLNKTLVKLDLSKNKLNKILTPYLKALSHIKSLRSLDLSNNYIDNRNSQILSDFLLEASDLEEYILSINLISFVTIEKICNILTEYNEKINLKRLKLANISFSLDCLISIGYLLDSNHKLIELDLSNNEIVKINTATLCNKPYKTIQKLQLRNCKYDEYQYKLLIKLLAKNPIKVLDLSGSMFFESNLIQFIKKTANLQTLTILDISYIPLKDLEISDLLNRLKNHQVLQELKLNFLDLKENSSKSLYNFLKINKSLTLLDLSDNKLTPSFFTHLRNGLIENKTLIELKLRKSRMNDEAFEILIEAFITNKILKVLDVRFNLFSIKSLEKLMDVMNRIPTKNSGLETLLLSENHLECKDKQEEFSLFSFSQNLKNNQTLKTIELENTFYFKPSELSHLSESLKNTTNLKRLNLSNNKLGQNEAIFLSKLILSCYSLEYLSVANNKLGITGIKTLLENLDKNLTLKEIDISGTLLSEQEGTEMCQYLYEILTKYSTLEILNISDNFIGEKGNKIIATMLKLNTNIYFINRHWIKIRNDVASQVLDSLIRVYRKIKNIDDLNVAIKNLDFSNGKLDDDFCINFSHNIQKYTYLESLNICENKKITLIGLKFIYVYLKYNIRLKKIYFKEYSHDSALNNGFATSIIHWSKYSHYKSRILKVIQKIAFTIFSKMQIIANRFQYNESFDKFFAPIKDFWIFMLFLVNFILQIFLALFLPIYYVSDKCGGGQDWNSHIVYGVYLGFTLCFEFCFLMASRKKIISNLYEKDLKREVIVNDALNLIGGVLLRFDTYTDVCFLTIAYQCNTDKIFWASLIVVIVKVIVKSVQNLRTLHKLLKRIRKKQKMDCLNLYAKLCCFQSMPLTNDILDRYCPGNAKRIHHILCKKLNHSIYLNVFILDSLLKFALEDIPQTILQSLFLFYKNPAQLQNSNNWIIWFSVLKNCCSLIGSFYSMVSIRPSYIEQSDFDESLTVQKLFEGEGKQQGQFGLSFLKRVNSMETKSKTGLLKFGTGITNMSNSSLNVIKGTAKRENTHIFKNDLITDKESEIALDLSEDVSFERPEKMRYFNQKTEEKMNFMDGLITDEIKIND